MKLLLFIILNLLLVPLNYCFYEGLDADLAIKMEKVRKQKRVLSINLLVDKEIYKKSSAYIKTHLKRNQGVLDQVLYYSLKDKYLYSFSLKKTKRMKFESNINESNREKFAQDIKQVLQKKDSEWNLLDYNYPFNEKHANWGWVNTLAEVYTI